MKKLTLIWMLMSLVVAGASSAFASDWLRVYNDDRQIQYQVTATEADEIRNGVNFIYSIPDSSLIDATQFGNYTLVMEGPGSQVVSDIFGINNSFLSFSSDSETASVTVPPNQLVVYEHSIGGGEFGGVFDATMYLNPVLRAEGWTAEFASDASSVPEPSTFLLLGAGLGGLAFIRRRK